MRLRKTGTNRSARLQELVDVVAERLGHFVRERVARTGEDAQVCAWDELREPLHSAIHVERFVAVAVREVRRVRDAVRAIQSRLGGAEAGRVSLSDETGDEGALSITCGPGGLAVVDEEPSTVPTAAPPAKTSVK